MLIDIDEYDIKFESNTFSANCYSSERELNIVKWKRQNNYGIRVGNCPS